MKGLLSRLDQHRRTTPNAPAVVFDGQQISYESLWSRSGKVADALSCASVGHGHRVLIEGQRDASLLIYLIGVLRCGAGYCMSEKRPSTKRSSPPHEKIPRDFHAVLEGAPNDSYSLHVTPSIAKQPALKNTRLVCLIKTSGSTGTPKTVGVTEDNLTHYCSALVERLSIHRPVCCGHVSSLDADLGNTSIFLAWWTGGSLVLASDAERKDPVNFWNWLKASKVTLLKITPSHWHAMLPLASQETHCQPLIDILILGGELLRFGLASQTLSSGCVGELWNHYGPTETTIGVAAQRVVDVDELIGAGYDSVPVGRALGATQFFVERDGDVVSSGTGELLIGGPGITLGYIGDPAETDLVFVTLEAENRPRVYRTGDQVRLGKDGLMEFLGRNDRQVKLNGYRVQLEALERIISHSLSAQYVACVVLPGEVSSRLALAVSFDGRRASPRKLGEKLARTLDPALLPSKILCLETWPMNSNRKTDYKEITRLLGEKTTPQKSTRDINSIDPTRPDKLIKELQHIWSSQLGIDQIGIDDDFFEIGGNSIDAIRMIGTLQNKGFKANAKEFLAKPTIRDLAGTIRAAHLANSVDSVIGNTDTLRLSPALADWFDNPSVTDRNYWNQAFILEVNSISDPKKIEHAVAALVARHPILSVQATCLNNIWQLEQRDNEPNCFSHSRLKNCEPAEFERQLKQAIGLLQTSINLERGSVFRVHLFSTGLPRDCIFFVAHHAIVDAVSWQILIDEMLEHIASDDICISDCSIKRSELSIADVWFREVEGQKISEYEYIHKYLKHCRERFLDIDRSARVMGKEYDAHSVWFELTQQETSALQAACDAGKVSIHVLLLAAFCHAYAYRSNSRYCWIEIEGHGRVRQSAHVDVSACIGWFTSVYPVLIEPVLNDFADTVNRIAAVLSGLPTSVVECGVSSHDLAEMQLPKPAFIYNFLGSFDLPDEHSLQPSFSRKYPGLSRGPENRRSHDIATTARVLEAALCLDCTFNPQFVGCKTMTEILDDMHVLLLEFSKSAARSMKLVRSKNASGALWYRPSLDISNTPKFESPYRSVLLTGATGFVGAHVAGELLRRGIARIHCITRGNDNTQAHKRLIDVLEWYGQAGEADFEAGRIIPHAGNLRMPSLGLTRPSFCSLANEIDAIYNCAADVRLFAPMSELRPINIDGVSYLLKLAEDAGQIDFHQVSTLAVAGSGALGDKAVFDESSFGSHGNFRNSYEESKHEAELLVRDYGLTGGRALIYRLGNVSAHSMSACFQRNAHENQHVQILQACVEDYEIDIQQSVALAPVDVVATGIVVLSLDGDLPAGIFHVDTPYDYPYERLTSAVRKVTFRSNRCLAKRTELGQFWLMREKCEVSFSNQRSLQHLKRLGVTFEPLPDLWFDLFARHLKEHDMLNSNTSHAKTQIGPLSPNNLENL